MTALKEQTAYLFRLFVGTRVQDFVGIFLGKDLYRIRRNSIDYKCLCSGSEIE